MTIGTWNVNGIRARALAFGRWVNTHRPDILCLQEIKAHPDQIPEHVRELNGYASYWHGAHGGYSGVSVHVRNSLGPHPLFSIPYFDEETRILQADLGELSIINTYIPLGQKNYRQKTDFLDALVKYLDALLYKGRKVVLCGDLNIAHTDNDVHPDMLQEDMLCTRPEERARLDRIVNLGLSDLFRKHHPHSKNLYSWWPYYAQARVRNIGWRIDYIFISNALVPSSRDCRIHKEESSSDHAPVVAEIEYLPR
jgi:exodeoxyribonuclease III